MRALSRLNTPETSRHLTNALRWFDPIFGRYGLDTGGFGQACQTAVKHKPPSLGCVMTSEIGEQDRMGKFPESAVEDKLAVSECVFEIGKKRPTKEPTEWFDRQEELLAARYHRCWSDERPPAGTARQQPLSEAMSTPTVSGHTATLVKTRDIPEAISATELQ